jgi:hypothetical protein
MAIDPKHFGELFSALTNALQAAAPLATSLRRELGEQAQDAVALEAAIDRAVRATRQLRNTSER